MSQARDGRLMGWIVTGRVWLVRLGFYYGRLLPQRRRVVLATAHFDRIEGNLSAIRDELARRHPQVRVTVLAYRSEPGLVGALRGMRNALVAGFTLATSRVFIVDDYFFPIYAISPRPGSMIVQVWHACGALKKFGHSIGGRSFGAGVAVTSRIRIHSNYDLCLASSESTAECYAEAFDQPKERFVWHLGIPRTDMLFRDVAGTVEAIRRRYRLPEGRRVVLYAPTFRGDQTYAARHPAGLDLPLLKQVLGDDHVMLLRLHPLVRSRLAAQPDLADFVIDASDHPEVNELMLAADVLVTDYSSVIFEFALLGRPIVLLAPDYEAYERERGLYIDLRTEGPGPVFETTAELAAYMRRGSYETEALERFREKWMAVADGRSTERFIDQVVLPALIDGHSTGRQPVTPASDLQAN